MSIKSTIAAVAASPFLLAGAAFAGPYVNVESNLSYPDGEYSAATTDVHLGYEGTAGAEGELSGKAGLTYQATDSFGVYGEISAITAEVSNDDQTNWGAKAGVKFTF